jgi:ribosomal protein S27E
MSLGLDDGLVGGTGAEAGGQDYLDGNALAGPLSEFSSGDLTVAEGRCENCGMTGALATTRVYAHAPGMTARCRGCGSVLLRLTEAGGRTVLDLRGLSYLSIQRG